MTLISVLKLVISAKRSLYGLFATRVKGHFMVICNKRKKSLFRPITWAAVVSV